MVFFSADIFFSSGFIVLLNYCALIVVIGLDIKKTGGS